MPTFILSLVSTYARLAGVVTVWSEAGVKVLLVHHDRGV
jgi:hypothetical protein